MGCLVREGEAAAGGADAAPCRPARVARRGSGRRDGRRCEECEQHPEGCCRVDGGGEPTPARADVAETAAVGDETAVASVPRNMQVNLATEGAAQAGATSTPATLREALQEALTATLRAQPDDALAYFADCLVHKPSATYAEAVLPRLEAAL